MSKIVLVGANHAGTAAANTILDNYPEEELVIIDRNSNISYLGCGTALWVGRQIDGTEGLFYCSQDVFKQKHARVYMETEVTNIDFAGKKVHAQTKCGEQVVEEYDKLILATGSLPIIPKISGLELENVDVVKLFQDGEKINKALDDESIRNVAVVGAGYIGVEIAEAVRRRGKNAMLFEAQGTSLSGYYDPWFTKDMDKVLADNGVELHFNEIVKELKGEGKVGAIVTDKGEYAAELVILAIGFVPNNGLAKGSLDLFSNGISIYGYHMVSTGLNLKAAEKAGMEVLYTDYEDLQKPAFIHDNHRVKIRIIYERGSRRIVGTQIASYEDIAMGIHMFSLAIEEGVTIDKLKLLDIFFLPHFNQPYNYITMAALGAE